LFYIDSLLIKGFRNYRHQYLHFHPRLNIIIGENAQGKSNLLESIYYLSVTRSFRTNRDQELAHWEDRFFYLKGCFVKNDFKNEVQINYNQNGQLKVLINNNPVKRYDNLQQFPVVAFSPDDLQIIKEGPSIRRRFLNLEASRLSPVYFKELRAYQRVLQQRNQLLKDKYNHPRINNLLEPWDQSLIALGSSIIHYRLGMIGELEKEAHFFFDQMTNSRENLSLEYISSIEASEDPQLTKESFCRTLQAKRDQELKRGSTLIGPHLDDLKISINDYDTRMYSSQGQKRTAALALKMAEVSLFNQKHDECPIILLDDVFSEFDDERKSHLLDFLKTNTGQCFITSAVGVESLVNNLERDHKKIMVHRGRIRSEKSGHGS